MADPFQDVDAAGAEFIAAFADSMDARQSNPVLEAIVAGYLEKLPFAKDSLTVEVGCGAGAVTRRIATAARPERVIGFDPSEGFVAEAKTRVADLPNVGFQVARGAALPLSDASVDNLVMHTVLSHVADPVAPLSEASRVLKPGGTLVICDADFSKATLGNFPNDPLNACAKLFVQEFVTDPHIVAKLRPLATAAGFKVTDFSLQGRLVLDDEQMLSWVEMPAKLLVERGEMAQALLEGLVAEYRRRAAEGRLNGYQVYATLVARQP